MRRPTPAKESQLNQAQVVHLGTDGRAFRWPVGTLTAAPQMLPQAPPHVAVDLAESASRVTVAKAAGPAFQVTIQFPDQLGERDAIQLRAGHLPQLHLHALQRVGGDRTIFRKQAAPRDSERDVDAGRASGQRGPEPAVADLQRRAGPQPITKGGSVQKACRSGVEFDCRAVNRVVDDHDH